MYRTPALMQAEQLHRRVLEQHGEPLDPLVDPGSDVSDGCGKELSVFTPRQTTVPRLDQDAR